jgi:putative oxidoreductase
MGRSTDGRGNGFVAAYERAETGLATVALFVAPPLLRVALAVPFLKSGLTRWDMPFHLSPSTLYLFEEEFQLHIFGKAYPFPAPDAAALLTAVAEMTLPTLLLLGLATRWTALSLLIMTGVIELVAPEGGLNFHLMWAAMAIAIMALGAGPLSLDQLIRMVLDHRRPSQGAIPNSFSPL